MENDLGVKECHGQWLRSLANTFWPHRPSWLITTRTLFQSNLIVFNLLCTNHSNYKRIILLHIPAYLFTVLSEILLYYPVITMVCVGECVSDSLSVCLQDYLSVCFLVFLCVCQGIFVCVCVSLKRVRVTLMTQLRVNRATRRSLCIGDIVCTLDLGLTREPGDWPSNSQYVVMNTTLRWLGGQKCCHSGIPVFFAFTFQVTRRDFRPFNLSGVRLFQITER